MSRKQSSPVSPVPSRPELTSLLLGAKEKSKENISRLIIADWLEEHGDVVRAEFIRLQCAQTNPESGHLGEREKKILEEHAAAWLAPFQRAAEQAGGKLLRKVPRQVKRYLRWSFVRGMIRLAIDAESFVSEPAAALAGTEAWAWVEQLVLRGAAGNTQGVLEKSPLWAGLPYIDFEDSKLGAEGARALAGVRNFTCLRHLDVGHNSIGPEGAAALAKAPWLEQLVSLDIAHDRIGDAGIAALAASPRMGHLSVLDVRDNRIGDAGAAALATSPYLAQLNELNLGGNLIGDTGGATLADSPNLKKDVRVNLYNNRISPEGEQRLRTRFGDRVI